MKRSNKQWLITFALVVLTATAYWEIKDHTFVSYDDDVYVVSNARVQSGLMAAQISSTNSLGISAQVRSRGAGGVIGWHHHHDLLAV